MPKLRSKLSFGATFGRPHNTLHARLSSIMHVLSEPWVRGAMLSPIPNRAPAMRVRTRKPVVHFGPSYTSCCSFAFQRQQRGYYLLFSAHRSERSSGRDRYATFCRTTVSFSGFSAEILMRACSHPPPVLLIGSAVSPGRGPKEDLVLGLVLLDDVAGWDRAVLLPKCSTPLEDAQVSNTSNYRRRLHTTRA